MNSSARESTISIVRYSDEVSLFAKAAARDPDISGNMIIGAANSATIRMAKSRNCWMKAYVNELPVIPKTPLLLILGYPPL